jgi:hypothetical protein
MIVNNHQIVRVLIGRGCKIPNTNTQKRRYYK